MAELMRPALPRGCSRIRGAGQRAVSHLLGGLLGLALGLLGPSALAGLKPATSTQAPRSVWLDQDFSKSLPPATSDCASVPTTQGQSRALLIGAHLYPKIGQPLAGPANDVALMANALQARGMPAARIETLINGQATRERALAGIEALLKAAGCHDSVVLYLGGHGASQSDLAMPRSATGGQPKHFFILEDGVAEPLTQPKPGGMLALSEIEQVTTLLRQRGAHVFLIADFKGSQAMRLSSSAGWYCCKPKEFTEAASGSLTVFLSPEEPPEWKLPQGAADAKDYGVFSFSVGVALAQRTLGSVRDIARVAQQQWDTHSSALGQARSTQAKDQPLFFASDPDLQPFGAGQSRSGGASPASAGKVAISLGEGGDTRGASVQGKDNLLRGRIQPSEGLIAVVAAGKPATLASDGRFSVDLRLKRGDNPVDLVAVFKDRPMHSEQIVVRSDSGQFEVTRQKRVFALLIGNQQYGPETGFAPLKTPHQDIETLRKLLTGRYGMVTEIDSGGGQRRSLVLKDATRSDIYQAMGLIARTADPEDSVLIYYAGHGSRAQLPDGGKLANWVPVNARKDSEGEDLVSAADLNNLIRKMRARHVLLVADSCYSGVLADTRGEPAATLETEQRDRYLSEMSRLKSRQLMSSGGDEPVSDDGGDGLSVFARALVKALDAPPAGIFTAEQLFHGRIKQSVAGRSQQVPQLQVIRDSGHENGSFTFFAR